VDSIIVLITFIIIIVYLYTCWHLILVQLFANKLIEIHIVLWIIVQAALWAFVVSFVLGVPGIIILLASKKLALNMDFASISMMVVMVLGLISYHYGQKKYLANL